MGFDRGQLVESLRNRIQNEVRYSLLLPLVFDFVFLLGKNVDCWIFQATVAYYLLLDNRFRPSNGYLGDEFQETMVRQYHFSLDLFVGSSSLSGCWFFILLVRNIVSVLLNI